MITSIHSPELDAILVDSMDAMANGLVEELREAAPVKTGELRDSIRQEDAGLRDWVVLSDSRYAGVTDKRTGWFTQTVEGFNGEVYL